VIKSTVLFDLGNTLVAYYTRSDNATVLAESLAEVRVYLDGKGLLAVSREETWERVQDEKHESDDHRVRPLEGRLARIFGLAGPGELGDVVLEMCRRFLRPVYARARRYEDSLPTLRRLRAQGVKTGIVSNTPWGSPASLWHEEIARHGLAEEVDLVVCCTDVGWRKPARQIFEYATSRLKVTPEQCLFIGDHPRCDVRGSRAVGMEALLIDRNGTAKDEDAIRNLDELWNRP
jgi:putative hydrolase of the HAD superfamily